VRDFLGNSFEKGKRGGYKKVTLMTFCFRLLEEKIEKTWIKRGRVVLI